MPKRTLREKYDIPLNHLDFRYIEECSNGKELERIYAILKSGQEGHFPDLTKCAEDKLRKINPESRQLKTEEPILRKSMVTKDEWENVSSTVQNWRTEVKEKEKVLRASKTDAIQELVPPVRETQNKEINKEKKNGSSQRIGSCDYSKWDKYDAETEVLKMDLDVDKAREKTAINSKLRAANQQKNEKIVDLSALQNLTVIEKERLADGHRIKGNDYFKAADYQNAINEYGKSIDIFPTAVVFCNRAAAYLKQSMNTKALDDSNESIKHDSKYIKAYIRKGQALINLQQEREAYSTFVIGLKIDPTNILIQKQIEELKIKFPDLPPENAYRMNIIEEDSTVAVLPPSNTNKNEKLPTKKPQSNLNKNPKLLTKPIEDDFAKLIIPNKIVKSKLKAMANTLEQMTKEAKHEFKKDLKNAKEKFQAKKEINIKPDDVKKRTTYNNGMIIEEL